MERQAAKTENDHSLKPIVSRLFSMASMAERASTLPGPVLFLLLWIFRVAEAFALDLVDEWCRDLRYFADLSDISFERVGTMDAGTRASEAMRLAISLRVLAEVLDDLGAAERTLQGRQFVTMLSAHKGRPPREALPHCFIAKGRWLPAFQDTS